MKLVRLFWVIAAALLLSTAASLAQPTPVIFSCIVGVTSTACPLGGSPSYASLESNTAPFTVGAIVSVSGYHTISDGGSGEFVMLGAQPNVCNIFSNTATGSAGSSMLNGFGGTPTNLTVGESVTGGGSSLQIQPGSEIASITTGGLGITAITLTLPLTGTNTSTSVNITISGSNSGTLILDNYGGTGADQCWQKTNYRGDPHEFGAYGDGLPHGVNGDTVPLQNWLGAYGNVSPLGPSTPPPNFGPWIASIPANYYVTKGLTCPNFAVLQGFANNTAATPGGSTPIPGNPTVRIFAGGSSLFDNSTALLTAGPYCRISGIAIDAMGVNNASSAPINAVDIGGTHVVIDDHSLIKNGYENVNCPGSTVTQVDGLQIKDSQILNATHDGIGIANGCSNSRVINDVIQRKTAT